MKKVRKINKKIKFIRLIGWLVGVFFWSSFVYQNYIASEQLKELSRQDWAVQTMVMSLLVIPLLVPTRFLKNKFSWPILFTVLCAGTLYWIYDRCFFTINMCASSEISQIIKIGILNVLITIILGLQVYAFIRIDRITSQAARDSAAP